MVKYFSELPRSVQDRFTDHQTCKIELQISIQFTQFSIYDYMDTILNSLKCLMMLVIIHILIILIFLYHKQLPGLRLFSARLHDWWNKMRLWNYLDKALKLRMNEVENVLEQLYQTSQWR